MDHNEHKETRALSSSRRAYDLILRGLLYFSSMYQDYVTGKNRKLMESCRPLHDYSLFVHRIREKLAEGYRPDDRMEDFWKAVEDEKLCRRLLKEYGINTTL